MRARKSWGTATNGPDRRLFQPASVHQKHRAKRPGLDGHELQGGRKDGGRADHGVRGARCGCDGLGQRHDGGARRGTLNLHAFRLPRSPGHRRRHAACRAGALQELGPLRPDLRDARRRYGRRRRADPEQMPLARSGMVPQGAAAGHRAGAGRQRGQFERLHRPSRPRRGRGDRRAHRAGISAASRPMSSSHRPA
jgi:hypothetical protein